MKVRWIVLVSCLAVLLFGLGCGSSSNTGSSAATPTANPGGTTGAGNGSSTSVQFAAETNDRTSGATGQLTLDTSGKGVLSLQHGGANAGVQLTWCNFPGQNGCFSNFATFTTDASGNATGTFTFPGHGNFAGTFGLTLGGTNVFAAGWNIPNGSTPFQSALLKAGSISAGLGPNGPIGSDPLTSGVVSIAAGSSTVHAQIQGASPSQGYSVMLCGMGASSTFGSSCETFGNLSTDATGNASGDFAWSSAGLLPGVDFSGVFVLRRAGGGPIEFVSGFQAP